jgi:hypothetical protein
MALNFPASPVDGQIYYDTVSGNRYIYVADTTKWMYVANNQPLPGSTSNSQVLFNFDGGVDGDNGLIFSSNTLFANSINVATDMRVRGNLYIGTNTVTITDSAIMAQTFFIMQNGTPLAVPTGSTTNASYEVANSAFAHTNATLTHSQAVYGAVNSVFGVTNSAYGSTNTVGGYANTAGLLANQAGVIANASFSHSNTTYAAVNSAFAVINAAFNEANVMPAAFGVANGAFDKANAANVLAYNTGIGANNYAGAMANSSNAYIDYTVINIIAPMVSGNLDTARTYTNTSTDAANSYSFYLYNDGRLYANTTVLGVSRDYTNTSTGAANAYAIAIGTSGNNYAGVMANSSNGYAITVGASGNNYAGVMANSSNGYTVTVGNSANNYAGAMANSANDFAYAGYTNVSFVLSVNMANNTVSANNYSGAMANSVNAYVNVSTGSSNAYANVVGTAGNTYTATVGTNANNYANATFVKLTAASQTITGDFSITGNLFIGGNTTSVSANNLVVNDSLIYLANNNQDDILDIGFVGSYYNATSAHVHTGLFREHSSKQYYLFQGFDADPELINDIVPYANNMVNATLVADFVTSNLTLGGANAIVWIKASYDNSNGGFGVTNAAFGHSNTIYAAVNSAFGVINAAFGVANTALQNTNTITINSNLTIPGNVSIGSSTGVNPLNLYINGSNGSLYQSATQVKAISFNNANNWSYANTTLIFNFAEDTGTVQRHSTGIMSGKEGPWVASSGNYPGYLTFWTRAAGTDEVERLRITSAGYVGIGTNSPGYTLDVAGSANISLPTLIVAGQNVLASFSSINAYASAVGTSTNNYTSATYSTLVQFGSVFGVANAAYGQSNSEVTRLSAAYVVANAAFAAGNAEFTFSNTIYAAVNSAFGVINAAYTSSNADYTVTNAAFAAANAKVASVTGTAGQIFSSGGTTPTLNLISSGVTARTYGGSTNIPIVTVDAFGRITSAANQSFSAGGVTSVSGAGTVSGLTLTGTVTTTGSLTLGGTLSATIDNISDEHRLFNNMGDNHATRTSFDATNPSYNFGWRFVQGLTNGPGVNGAGQYYSEYVGLGNDYLATGAGSYGMQIAYPRNVSTPYIAIRYNENNTLGAWQKISAGYADTVGSITSGQVTTALGFTPYNSTNPSGYITSSALSSYAPLAGPTLTGTTNISKLITSSRIVLPSTNDGRTNGLWHWGDSDSNWVQYMAQPTVGTNPAGTTMTAGYWDNGHTIRVRGGAWSYENHSDNTLRAHINGTGAFFAGQTRSPIYYDSNDTTYYNDLNSSRRFAGRSYIHEWIEFVNYTGLYSPNNGAHFYPNNGTYGAWRIDGARNGWNGIEFAGHTTLMMNDNGQGFHRNTGGGWRFYVESGNGYFPGNVTAYWSDRRLKENLRTINGESIEILSRMTAYRFNWNDKVKDFCSDIEPGKEEIGLIAQEVQAVLPDAVVVNKSAVNETQEESDYLTINWNKITPLLVQALNETTKELAELKQLLKDKGIL